MTVYMAVLKRKSQRLQCMSNEPNTKWQLTTYSFNLSMTSLNREEIQFLYEKGTSQKDGTLHRLFQLLIDQFPSTDPVYIFDFIFSACNNYESRTLSAESMTRTQAEVSNHQINCFIIFTTTTIMNTTDNQQPILLVGKCIWKSRERQVERWTETRNGGFVLERVGMFCRQRLSILQVC